MRLFPAFRLGILLAAWLVIGFARAAPAPDLVRDWEVWVAFNPKDPEADPGRDVGIVRVFMGDFPACCLDAAYYRPQLTEVTLVPMSLGCIVRGRYDGIRVVVTGELDRLGNRRVDIHEASAQRIGAP